MTKITKTVEQITVTRYTWNCPACDVLMSDEHEPQELLCYGCFSDRERQAFMDSHDFLVSSVITRMVWTTGMGFSGVVVVDKGGSAWQLSGPLICEDVPEKFE